MTLKEKYSFIEWIMKDCNDFDFKKRLNIVATIKKEVRECMKPLNTDPFIETYHYTDGYGENFYIKQFFEYPFAEEEKDKFIKEQWQHINSPYDCTGLRFTKYIRICNFKEPNSFGAMSVVYHFMGTDV